MNIKSLLLGSAVALVAVSGARAADAVVAADPEPAEYVRVCDAYGVGYFYIPGTETCLSIRGHVRYEIMFGGIGATGFGKNVNGRLEILAKNESDLGTVSSYIRINGNSTATAGDFGSVQAYGLNATLGVGGLEMGAHDSETNQFFGYGVATDLGHGGYGYGYQYRHYISYTYTGEAMSAYITLDHDGSANYVPDVAFGAKGKFGNVEVAAGVGFDTSRSAQTFRAQISAPLSEKIGVKIQGFYNNGTAAGAGSSYWGSYAGGSWSINAGIAGQLTDKLSAGVSFQYIHDTTAIVAATSGYGNAWGVTGDVTYTIAPGLTALLEVNNSRIIGSATGVRATSGFLRFQRSF